MRRQEVPGGDAKQEDAAFDELRAADDFKRRVLADLVGQLLRCGGERVAGLNRAIVIGLASLGQLDELLEIGTDRGERLRGGVVVRSFTRGGALRLRGELIPGAGADLAEVARRLRVARRLVDHAKPAQRFDALADGEIALRVLGHDGKMSELTIDAGKLPQADAGEQGADADHRAEAGVDACLDGKIAEPHGPRIRRFSVHETAQNL